MLNTLTLPHDWQGNLVTDPNLISQRIRKRIYELTKPGGRLDTFKAFDKLNSYFFPAVEQPPRSDDSKPTDVKTALTKQVIEMLNAIMCFAPVENGSMLVDDFADIEPFDNIDVHSNTAMTTVYAGEKEHVVIASVCDMPTMVITNSFSSFVHSSDGRLWQLSDYFDYLDWLGLFNEPLGEKREPLDAMTLIERAADHVIDQIPSNAIYPFDRNIKNIVSSLTSCMPMLDETPVVLTIDREDSPLRLEVFDVQFEDNEIVVRASQLLDVNHVRDDHDIDKFVMGSSKK